MSVPADFTRGSGSTYYVDYANGSDANPGTLAQPWKSLVHANATVAVGDTILLRGGDYAADDKATRLVWDKSGAAGNFVSIEAYPGETPVIWQMTEIANPYVRFKGVIWDKNAYPTDASPPRPVGPTPGNVGVWINTASGNVAVTDHEIRNTTMSGMLVAGAPNIQVRRGYHHNIGGTTDDHGLYWSGGDSSGSVIDSCIFDQCANLGLQFHGSGGPSNVLVVDCLGTRCTSGYIVDTDGGASGIAMHNCIAYNNAEMGFRTLGGTPTSGNTLDHCMAFGNPQGDVGPTGYGSFNSNTNFLAATDPKFVAPTGTPPNYRLQATSPAISAADASFSSTLDRSGNTRDGSPDIGPYEYLVAAILRGGFKALGHPLGLTSGMTL